ncbi:hypothetical protein [Deinococcus koreensis]|uniref:Uncharacterized protein n=1 Tax=Deinococcus koreensis TaxID=2054903 RepID=A0A2K3UXX5_9DEIO|nr:hypothetical protein [Deinococcus koreensis]PNY81392.1 hypothetical protein CVO96_08345 [Deinococcus koreensis]
MTTHVLEVGRAPATPTRVEADTLEAATRYIERRTGRPDAALLAALAWHGAQVQVGRLLVRGWTRSDQARPCPHCGEQVWARAVTCAEEAELAGLEAWGDATTAWTELGLVFPSAACDICGENLTFSVIRPPAVPTTE